MDDVVLALEFLRLNISSLMRVYAFAKQKPTGEEAKIIAALDGEDAHYLAMETALLWRLTPFGFRSRPPMERAIMLAHHRERSMRSAMLAKVQHDQASKKSKPTTPDHTADFFGGV